MNKIIFPIIIIANLVLAGSQLWLTTLRATDGQELATIEDDLRETKLSNWRLKDEIYTKSSLQYVYLKSQTTDLTAVKPEFAPISQPLAKTISIP